MEKKRAGQNPGLIWCNSKITKPDELSWDTFCNWYQDIHVPDVLKTGAISEAFRYVFSQGTDSERPHMALYYVDDVEGVLDKVKGTPVIRLDQLAFADPVQDVPHHDEKLPGSHDAYDYADFDTRIYKLAQLYEVENPNSGTEWLNQEEKPSSRSNTIC